MTRPPLHPHAQHVAIDGPSPQRVQVVEPPRKLRFDPTINLGHVISLVAFLAAASAAWANLDKRVVVLEEARRVQIERDAQQDGYLKERLVEIQRGQESIARQIDRMSDKIDVGLEKARTQR